MDYQNIINALISYGALAIWSICFWYLYLGVKYILWRLDLVYSKYMLKLKYGRFRRYFIPREYRHLYTPPVFKGSRVSRVRINPRIYRHIRRKRPRRYRRARSPFRPKLDESDILSNNRIMLLELQPYIRYLDKLFSFRTFFLAFQPRRKTGFFGLYSVNSSFFVYYFLIIYFISYWYTYFSYIFFFMVLVLPFFLYLVIFVVFTLLAGNSSKLFPIKLHLEDTRYSGYIRNVQLVESNRNDLSRSLQLLNSSILKQFMVSSSKNFSFDNSVFISPEYAHNNNLGLISKYVRDVIILNPNSSYKIFDFLFSDGFLNLLIYLKIDSIWNKNHINNYGFNTINSNKFFLSEKISQKGLFVSKVNYSNFDFRQFILGSSLNNVKNIKKLALDRMGLYDFGLDISADLFVLNSRSQYLLSDPFLDSISGNLQDLSLLGLNNFTKMFYEKFLLVFDRALNSIGFNKFLNKLGILFEYGFLIKSAYVLNSKVINSLWNFLFFENSWSEVKIFLKDHTYLINEVWSLIKNPFNCGIWSYLLSNSKDFSIRLLEFYSTLFSISSSSVWKGYFFEYFIHDSFLHLAFIDINHFFPNLSEKFNYNNNGGGKRLLLSRLTVYDVLYKDPFWVKYFRNFPYKSRIMIFMFFRNLFRNPFFSYKQGFICKRKTFGFSFWKFYIENRISQLLLSNGFKQSFIKFSGNTLFNSLQISNDSEWSSFFNFLHKKEERESIQNLSMAEIFSYNLKIHVLKFVLDSPYNSMYSLVVSKPSLSTLYSKLFLNNSAWLSVLQKPASFRLWSDFFNSVSLSELGEFFNHSLSTNFLQQHVSYTVDGLVSRLSFIRLVFKNSFKSLRSGFSAWQGVSSLVYSINQSDGNVFDLSNFGFSCNYLFFLFESDLKYLLTSVSHVGDNLLSFRLFDNFRPSSRSDLSFFSYVYPIFKPLFIQGEFYKSGSRSNRNASLSEKNIPLYRTIGVTDSWLFLKPFWETNFSQSGKIQNNFESLEGDSFPVCSSAVNSSDILSKNILLYLSKFYIKLYYKFNLKFISDNIHISDLFFFFNKKLFNEYLVNKCSLAESFILDNLNMFNKNLQFVELSRFEILKYFLLQGEMFFYYGYSIFLSMYKQEITNLNNFNDYINLNLAGFYGLSNSFSELKSGLSSRNLRQLYGFMWIDRDESDRFSFMRESRRFKAKFFSSRRSIKDMSNSKFLSFPGVINRFIGLNTYSKVNSIFERNLILNDSITAGTSSFFPYGQKSYYKVERMLFFRVLSTMGFFIPNRYYISSNINYFSFLFFFIRNLFYLLLVWFDIIYRNKFLFYMIFFGIFLIVLSTYMFMYTNILYLVELILKVKNN